MFPCTMQIQLAPLLTDPLSFLMGGFQVWEPLLMSQSSTAVTATIPIIIWGTAILTQARGVLYKLPHLMLQKICKEKEGRFYSHFVENPEFHRYRTSYPGLRG